MQKKYKLLYWYPSLPTGIKEGEKVRYVPIWKGYTTDSLALGGKSIPKSEVEKNPEFWEKIVEEKPYKILSIKDKLKDRILLVKDFSLTTGAYLERRSGSKTFNGEKDTIAYIMGAYNIFSVERLSDNEVFEVGDEVKCWNGIQIISNIYFYNGEIRFWMEKQHGTPDSSGYTLDHVKHVRRVVFKADDGMDIRVGDRYYFVSKQHPDHVNCSVEDGLNNSHDFNYFAYFSTREKAEEYVNEHKVLFRCEDGVEMREGDRYWVPQNGTNNVIEFKATHLKNYKTDNSKRFSTKELAEQYVEDNKPKYSKKEVKDALKQSIFHIASSTLVIDVDRVKRILDL